MYDVFRHDLEWWPATPGMTPEEILASFHTQWARMDADNEQAKQKLITLLENTSVAETSSLMEAVRAAANGKKPRTVAYSTIPHLDYEDLANIDDPEIKTLMQDLLLAEAIIEEPRTPIPEVFFADDTWTFRNNLLPQQHAILSQDAGEQIPRYCGKDNICKGPRFQASRTQGSKPSSHQKGSKASKPQDSNA